MFYLKSPTTLTQAIATAKGFKPASKKDSIRIFRQKEGSSEREELIFKLKDIEEKKIPDPLLQANDIVAVSEDKIKNILNNVTETFKNGIPSLFYRVP
jgi:protein involved in polysaccharide export with SLBB domain